jgi:neutral ceramidase
MCVFPQVLARLKPIYGGAYTQRNVMLSASHTHSTPGGHMQNLLFDLSILGFVRQTFVVLVAGVVKVRKLFLFLSFKKKKG